MAYPRHSTRKQRTRWYYQVYACGKSVVEVCHIFGISRQCYYEWDQRDHVGDRTYRSPRGQPKTKLTSEIKQFIEQTKWKTNYGPKKMVWAVQQRFGVTVSSTIIYRFYKRKGLIRKPQKRLPWYQPLKHHVPVTTAGEGVQLDIKYIYPNGVRHYQFSVFDPYTEQYYFWIADTKHANHAVTALRGAQEYFGFPITSVQTDNGSEFRGDFHTWLTAHHLPHYFIPKGSPYWNGKVERVHRTMDEEYYLNPYRMWKTPYDWLYYYNYERLHCTLNGLTPKQFTKEQCHP